MSLNAVQIAAYELIQSDARFLYSLISIQHEVENITGNFFMMSQPYIGIFADGAEQWCRKIGMKAPTFTEIEKRYYTDLRQSHKLYGLSYSEFESTLMSILRENDAFFYSNRSLFQKLFGYYNVGTDLCNGEYSGNTILCEMYMPMNGLHNSKDIGPWIRDISIVAGKLAAFFGCVEHGPYLYNDKICVRYKDFHFYNNCPIWEKTDLGFVLFSILCSVNYAVEFIDQLFVEEIPQKFKIAYLQYYYLCSFITELNRETGTDIYLNDSLKDRDFRNCLAHYGLGQYLEENDVIPDPLKGLTIKAFNMVSAK